MQVDKGFKVGDVVEVINTKTWSKIKVGMTFIVTQQDVVFFDVTGEYHFNDNKYRVNFTLDMLKLVEPKQEQYYTSKPTNVKVGDKFEVIGLKRIGGSTRNEPIIGAEIGQIVILDENDKSVNPFFRLNPEKRASLNWGWLKPVKEGYKVGDWVQLIDKNFYSHVSEMNKFKGTIQQIGSKNKYDDNVFYLKGDDKMWAFVPSDFVKKVDAPVTHCKLVAEVLFGKDSLQQFNIGDKVKLLYVPTGSCNKHLVGQEGTVIDTRNYGFQVNFNSQTYWCKPEQLQLLILEKTGMFNIGDEVEFINQTGMATCFKIGEKGVITNYDSKDNFYNVKINNCSQWLRPSQIKLVNNKIEQNVSKESSTNSMSFSTTSYKITRGQEICSSGPISCKSRITI